MIRGIGIDLVEIDRIAAATEKPHFAARIFTEAENSHAHAKSRPAESYAGMFAAKEAMLKAFGTGIGGADFSEMEILHDTAGRPFFHLSGRAQEQLAACGAVRVHLSISHTKTYAVAEVILED